MGEVEHLPWPPSGPATRRGESCSGSACPLSKRSQIQQCELSRGSPVFIGTGSAVRCVEAGSPGRSSLCQQRRERFRSEEHTSELQSLMRSSYAVFCLKKK